MIAATRPPHVSVCVATYRRPAMLDECIGALQAQSNGPFSYSITVVDNDASESARCIVQRRRKCSRIAIEYDVEPVANISAARNRAVKNAHGNLIAFVDDDEIADPMWLYHLVAAYFAHSADGVLGPVIPRFDSAPPRWLIKSRLCVRRRFATGSPLRSVTDMRTGNVLLGRHVLQNDALPFHPRFGRSGGEDSDFFARKLAAGYKFIWCDEARVHEHVPAHRQRLVYFLRRAAVLGTTAAKRESVLSVGTLRSILAVTLYSASLPLAILFSYSHFVRILVKDCNHGAKLLGHLGLDLFDERAR